MARRRSITAGVLAVVMVGLLWLFFAPVQLGGPVVYTATVGNSMEPRFHKGDLALVRPAASYAVGDVVLYQSPVLHRAVLHRILLVQNGHYFFKGDHNTFVDPGYATRADLLGKLWLRVPRAGKGLSWVGKPAHSALVTATAAMLLLLGGTRKRRKDGRRRGTESRLRRPRVGVGAILRRGLHRPRRTPAFAVGVVALLAGILLVPLSFLSPLRKTVPWTGAFSNTGAFSYSATTKASAAYPDGTVQSGQPLFLTVVKNASVSFVYRFRSALPHQVHGTISLRARLSSDSWHHSYPLRPSTRFVGDGAALRTTVNLRDLQTLAQQLAVESGTVGASYDVVLEPVVHVAGFVGGKPVDSFFAPTLPFTLAESVLKPNPPQAETIPGAEYQQPAAASVLSAALHPVAAGSIPVYAPGFVSIARYSLPVSTGRGLGLGLLAFGILACLSGQFRRRRDVWSDEQRIAFRRQCVIVDVSSLPATSELVEMADFEQLAALAEFTARPILREPRLTGDLYAVEDGARRYTFRATAPLVPTQLAQAPAPPASPQPVPLPVPRAAAAGRRGGGSLPPRAGALLVVIGITVAAATAFTAGNTVPPTNAGTSAQAKANSQLIPALCSSIAPTTVVAPSGSYGGAAASELILGPNVGGSVSLKGGGGDDCIVAGGGPTTNNTIDGGSGTNVCIGSPTAKSNSFKNCAVTG